MLTCYFMNFFPPELARSLTVEEQRNVPTYYAIKVVIIGCIVGNWPVMSVFIALLWPLFYGALFFILMSLLEMHYIFLTLCGVKTKMPLTVLNCHTVLIENVCRLLYKSMLPTIFIKLCVKLKHIHLVSYVGVEKLTSKGNAALW